MAANPACVGVAQAGDTLASVAKQFGYLAEELVKVNPAVAAGDLLEAGVAIYLPECDRYTLLSYLVHLSIFPLTTSPPLLV
jgi:hypothetical protein